MGRLIAFNLLFFMVPFVVYLGWLYMKRGRVNDTADWTLRIVGWLAAGGAVIMIASLLVFVHFSGAPPGAVYVPAEIVDGELVPGHFE